MTILKHGGVSQDNLCNVSIYMYECKAYISMQDNCLEISLNIMKFGHSSGSPISVKLTNFLIVLVVDVMVILIVLVILMV